MAEPVDYPDTRSQLPEQWRLGEGRLRRQVAKYVTFAFLILAVGVALAVAGDVYGLVALLVAPVLLTVCIGGLVLARSRARRRADEVEVIRRDGGGQMLFMPYSRAARLTSYLIYLSFFVCFAGLPFVAYATPDDGSRDHMRLQILSIIGLAAVVWSGAYLLSYFVRRGQRMGLGIESSGVYHSSWFGAVFYRWELIDSLAIHPRLMAVNLVLNDRGKNWARNPSGGDTGEGAFLRAAQRRRLTRLPLGNLAVRPGAGLQTLALYEEHPELRAELDTEGGLQRLRHTGPC